MKGILTRSMANILGAKKEFKFWQAMLFFGSTLTVLLTILIIG